MSAVSSNRPDNVAVAVRAGLAASVMTTTILVWATVWYLGFAFIRLEFVIGAPLGIRSPAALDVCWFLQWIVGALALFLILALFVRPLYMRAAAQAWFLALCCYAVSGLIGFRDLSARSLLSIIPAVGVLGWVLYLTGVRPNMRLKLTARVD